jgi:hypothetical protein
MKNAKLRMKNAKLKNKEFRCNRTWEEILFKDDKDLENYLVAQFARILHFAFFILGFAFFIALFFDSVAVGSGLNEEDRE